MRVLPLLAVTGLCILRGYAQEVKPSPVLNIVREAIKEGRGSAHERVEADYAAAFRKANFPEHYVALASMSGPNEVWFVQPMPSFAINEEYEKAAAKEPLKSALGLLDARDGELRASSRTIWAVYRPDLSYKPEKFGGMKIHYSDVGTFRVKMGRGMDFDEGAKTYFANYGKANVDLCVLAYEVTAGAPGGTYLFFTMMDSMKVLDGDAERSKALMDVMGKEKFAEFMKGMGDVIVSIEDNLFEVKPGMSYPAQSTVDRDPDFWKPKTTAAAAVAQPVRPATPHAVENR